MSTANVYTRVQEIGKAAIVAAAALAARDDQQLHLSLDLIERHLQAIRAELGPR
jgi:hypothetical protein